LSENSDLEGVISRMRRYLGIEIPLRLLTFSEDVIDGVPTFTAEPYVVDEPTATRLQESSEVVREAKRRYYEELKKEIEG